MNIWELHICNSVVRVSVVDNVFCRASVQDVDLCVWHVSYRASVVGVVYHRDKSHL